MEQGCCVEGVFIGVHDFGLNGFGGPPFVPGVVVPFAPGSEDSEGDEGEAGVAVVFRAEGGDEVFEGLAEARIFVVGGVAGLGRKGLGVGVFPGVEGDTLVDEPFGGAWFLTGVVEIPANDELGAA